MFEAAICAPPEKFLEVLQEQFREEIVWFGKSDKGDGVTLHESPDGTWTLVITRDGRSCLIASGDGAANVRNEKAGSI